MYRNFALKHFKNQNQNLEGAKNGQCENQPLFQKRHKSHDIQYFLVFISTMFLQSNVDSCKYFWKTQHLKMYVFAFVLSAKDFHNCLVFFIYRVTGEGLKCLSESHWASSWVIVYESKSICYVLPHHGWPSVHVLHMMYTKTLLFAHCPFWPLKLLSSYANLC